MKKTTALLLSLIMILGILCACGSEDSSTNKDATTAPTAASDTPEGAVQIYLDNASLWEASSDEAPFGYLFIDLDFDGTLELVQSTTKNNTNTNKFFRIDKDSNSVVEITECDEDAISRWDFTGGDYPQLYKNNSTGELKYMVYDNVREEGVAGGTRIGEMTYTNNKIKTCSLWGFRYASADGTYDGNFIFTYTSYDKDNNEKEITSDEYNSTLEAYEQNNTNQNLRFKHISSTTTEYSYSELSAVEKYDLLLDAYKSFTYAK